MERFCSERIFFVEFVGQRIFSPLGSHSSSWTPFLFLGFFFGLSFMMESGFFWRASGGLLDGVFFSRSSGVFSPWRFWISLSCSGMVLFSIMVVLRFCTQSCWEKSS